MTTQDVSGNVNIFASLRLIDRFCKGECQLRKPCDPKMETDESCVIPEPNKLILGRIAQGLCPIANRVYPREGWSPGPFGCER